MEKIIKTALGATLLFTLGATTLNASSEKGLFFFSKNLKNVCGISEAEMAGKHTQEEWLKINNAGGIVAEIKTICPGAEDSALKDRYLEHYFDFFFEYGSDSGNMIYM